MLPCPRPAVNIGHERLLTFMSHCTSVVSVTAEQESVCTSDAIVPSIDRVKHTGTSDNFDQPLHVSSLGHRRWGLSTRIAPVPSIDLDINRVRLLTPNGHCGLVPLSTAERDSVLLPRTRALN